MVSDFTSVDTRVPFVGRVDELKRLFALFEYGGALTLVGPAGVGKSRLAFEAIARFERDRARDVIFVPLSGAGPEAVFGALVAAVGAREQVGRDPLEIINHTIAARRSILVLDNCEHVPDEAAALIESLQRVHHVAIVATSQRRLDYPDERVLEVGPFDAATGAEFFRERARAAGIHLSDEDVPIAATIVERLDGLAVAIDLAAARLASLSVHELARELENLRPYHFRSSAASDPRHHSLGKMIDWSLAPLDESAHAVFALASVFTGAFDAGDIVALDDGDLPSTAQALTELADRSLLVRADSTRYSMLTPMHAIAARMLAARSDRPAIDERFARHINTTVAHIRDRLLTPSPGAAMQELLDRYDDACAALAWALKRAHERLPSVLDIATSLVSIWAGGGRLREGSVWMERLMEQAGQLPQALYARLSNAAMRVAYASADYQRMLALGPTAISAFTILGDRLGLARAYNALAVASLYVGKTDDASLYVETAVALYRAIEHPTGVGVALVNQGSIALEGHSDPIGARSRYLEALEILLESGPDTQIGLAYGNLAEAAYFLHDPVDTANAAHSALRYFERSQSPSLMAWQYEVIGRSHLVKGDLHEAARSLRRAIALLDGAPQPIYLAQAVETAVRLLLLQREFERAAPLSFAARRLRRDRRIPAIGLTRTEIRADEERLAAALGPDEMHAAAAQAQAFDLAELGRLAVSELDQSS